MKRSLAPLANLLRRHAAAVIVLVTGVLLSLSSAAFVARAVERQQVARFREAVGTSDAAIRRRMDTYIGKLRAARGFVEVLGRDPTREEFRRFVASLELPRFYPGSRGVGWSKALAPGMVARHEAAQRAAGAEDYRVWPEGERDFYTSIVHLEPLDWRNQRALGYDMFSESVRREAMQRARDTGEPAATGKVELVQEAGAQRQAGFLVYLPVYEQPPRSLEERRELLLGWIYTPFRAGDLLRGTLGPEQAKAIGVTVYDGASPDPEALLYDAGIEDPSALTAVRQVDVAGRTWTVQYVATRAFATRTERALPGTVLAAGLVLSFLLFWVVREDTKARGRAERAAERASALADAGKLLASSPDYASTLPDVAALAAGRIADACLVHLAEGPGPAWIVGHADPEQADRAAEALAGTRLDEVDVLGAGAALRTGEPQVRERLGPRQLGAGGALGAVARELGATRSVAVALSARGQTIGVIVLLGAARGAVAREDVRVAEDLARLVSSAVDASRLYARAQEAIAARDEFLSIASHELKTPLTSLVLHSDSLRSVARRGQFDQAARKAEVIRRNVDRLSRLVSSLLDISRISAGRLELELEDVDLAEVAREVAGRFEDEARRAGCTLRVSAENPVVGRWDRMRLDQVITNLLSNAIKYGPGRPVEVSVEANGRAVLSVRDHGIGISQADQRRIFQRFERAVSKRNYGGFGLGLWIVRQIVESLGGSVHVQSAPGGGSLFTVELTRESPALTGGSVEHASRAPPP